MIKKKYLSLLFLFFSLTLNAQNIDTVNKTIDSITEKLMLRDYEKAYSYVSFMAQLFKNSTMTPEALSVCEQAVDLYAQELLVKRKWQALVDLGTSLTGAPLSVQKKAEAPIALAITEFVKIDEKNRALELSKSKAAALAKKNATAIKKIDPVAAVVPATIIEPTSVPDGNAQGLDDLETQALEIKQIISQNFTIAFVVLFFLLLILFLVLILVIGMFTRKHTSYNLMQPMISDPNFYPFFRNETGHSDALEMTFSAIDEKELELLVRNCYSLGLRIDMHTGRKNNSRHVAELVYNICRFLGYSHKTASVFYAVGLIRDIGFFSNDSTLFASDKFSTEEILLVRSHTVAVEKMGLLIGEGYRSFFMDGILHHHENLDGSGYPNGLKGKKIPLASQIIRVAESYVALVSNLPYRTILDRNTAFEELKKCAPWYDKNILAALEESI